MTGMNYKSKRNTKTMRVLCLALVLLISLFTAGCGKKKNDNGGSTVNVITTAATSADTTSKTTESITDDTSDLKTEKTTEKTTEDVTERTTEKTTEEITEKTTEKTTKKTTEEKTETTEDTEEYVPDEDLPDKDGSYTSKDDVALYLYVYGELPNNFITKKEAKKLGWEGGSLEPYAPGKAIGGDKFGNYEGVLPKGNYHECDIDTLGKKSRGAKRIVYSDDGRIYYTDDHYETFTLLYGEEK